MNSLSRRFAVPTAISLSIFGGLFLGFPKAGAPAKKAAPVDLQIVDYVMPTIPPDESDKTTENLETPKSTTPIPRGEEMITTTPPIEIVFAMPPEPKSPVGDIKGIDRIPFDAGVLPSPGSGSKGRISLAGELDNHPRATFQPAPLYPYEPKRSGIEGSVDLEFIVETDGLVSNARVVGSTNQGFEEASLQAIRRWHFEAGLKAGHKVRFRMAQTLVFKLQH